MIAKIKYRTEVQPNIAESHKQLVKNKEVECKRINTEGDITKFEKQDSFGKYKPVFLVNSNHLIEVEVEYE